VQTTTILFDLDGTLTDPKPGITRCIQHALTELGYQTPESESLQWCIGPPLRQSFSRLLGSSDGQLLEQAVELYRQRFSTVGLFENRVYKGVPETLADLRRQGHRLFLATAKPRIFAEQILEHFGLAQFFETAHGSELNGHLTDKSSLVRHILAVEHLAPERTMIIGDRKYDIVGGKVNGLATGAVTYGYGTVEELHAEGPDAVFDSPEQILTHPPFARGRAYLAGNGAEGGKE
jgi:phosphoglycolate phosphatase